ncbi:MAG: hypothetical protein WEB60_04865, partial [Terrimicrobiaceae bacterium]
MPPELAQPESCKLTDCPFTIGWEDAAEGRPVDLQVFCDHFARILSQGVGHPRGYGGVEKLKAEILK